MDLQFYGANAVTLNYKGTRVVVDDNLAELGKKSILKDEDIALYTGQHAAPAAKPKLLVDHPGEYEVSDISVIGVPARAHLDEDTKSKNSTIYKVTAGEINVLIVGHIYPDITEAQLEKLGKVDVMVVPVGGNGYTLDPIGALKLIKEVEPKLVIPTHYEAKDLNYPVPQQELPVALKELAMEPRETVAKLKLKAADFAESGAPQLVILEQS